MRTRESIAVLSLLYSLHNAHYAQLMHWLRCMSPADGCRMRPWPQNTKRRWPLRAVEGRVASVRSLSLPLATLWLDAVTLAAVGPAFLPGVDVWPPAQHDLAALWSPCLHVAPTEVPSSRRPVAVDASRRWLSLRDLRPAVGLKRRSRRPRPCFTSAAGPPQSERPAILRMPSLAGARLRTTKTELPPQFRLYGCQLNLS